MEVNKNAILFNPAAPNPDAYGIDKSKYSGKMTSYIVKGEILNEMEKDYTWPIGNQVYLPTQSNDALENHSMDSVKSTKRSILK